MPPRRAAAGPIPKEATRFFAAKRIEPDFEKAATWQLEHRVAFTVAQIAERDMLQSIRESLFRALRDGITFEQWRAEVFDEFMANEGWINAPGASRQKVPHRLEKIFTTNMRTARAAGQWQRIQRVKESRPMLQYMLGPSENHRSLHVEWAEKPTILPVDHPWWITHMPPNGWGCKCWVLQLSARQASNRGGVSAAPKSTLLTHRNRRSGQIIRVPQGIDPGFEFNPGIERRRGLEAAAERAHRMIDQALQSVG